MKALVLVAALAACLGACGGKSAAHDGGRADGGGNDGDGAEVAPTGWRVDDVTATLTVTADAAQAGSWTDFPTIVALVFAWNTTTGEGYALGGGATGKESVTTTDGATFATSLLANTPFATACGGVASVVLDVVTFSLDGEGLRGTGTGKASYVTSGATRLEAPVTATLVGAPSAVPPGFASPGKDLDPLGGVDLESTEPLPEQAGASLVGAPGGDVVALGGAGIGLPNGGIHAFAELGLALRYGETYTLRTDQVTDFVGRTPAPVNFTTRDAPPLVPEDGFESVTGTMFAGAGVLHGGPLAPIAGETSLLLNTGFGGGFGFLPYDLGPGVAVRLALAPGDTVVRFDAQLIAPDPIDQASFVGTLRWGSEGGTVSAAQNVDGSGFVKTTLPALGDVYVSPVKTYEYPLPAGAAGEIAFEIVGQTFACTPPPSPTVLVLDNLRAE